MLRISTVCLVVALAGCSRTAKTAPAPDSTGAVAPSIEIADASGDLLDISTLAAWDRVLYMAGRVTPKPNTLNKGVWVSRFEENKPNVWSLSQAQVLPELQYSRDLTLVAESATAVWILRSGETSGFFIDALDFSPVGHRFTLPLPGDQLLQAAAPGISRKGMAVGGWSRASAGGPIRSVLYFISPNGAIVQTVLGDEQTTHSDLIETSDEVLCLTRSTAPLTPDVLSVSSVDLNGNERWVRSVAVPGLGKGPGQEAVLTVDSKAIYAVGAAETQPGELVGVRRLWFWNLTRNGIPKSAPIFTAPIDWSVRHLARTADGAVVLTGTDISLFHVHVAQVRGGGAAGIEWHRSFNHGWFDASGPLQLIVARAVAPLGVDRVALLVDVITQEELSASHLLTASTAKAGEVAAPPRSK